MVRKPPRKSPIQGRISFWWFVVRESFSRAIEPFEKIGTLFAILAGGAAVGFLFHLIRQDRVDYMIYWTIAVPSVVWVIIFLHNIISIPHELLKNAKNSNAPVSLPLKKSAFRGLVRIIFLVSTIAAFFSLWLFKNQQIAEIKNQIPQKPTIKKTVRKKPLAPINLPKSIPTPSLMAITPNPPQPTIITQQQLETYEETTDGVPSFASLIAERQAQAIADSNAQQQADINAARDGWNLYKPYYKRALTIFRDTLISEAAKNDDRILQSPNYFTCLPDVPIAQTNGITILAVIQFQRKTNMYFNIALGEFESGYHRQLIISGVGCYVEFEPEWGQSFHRIFHVDNPPFDAITNCSPKDADDLILRGSKEIISAREYIISQQDNNKSVTNMVDRTQ